MYRSGDELNDVLAFQAFVGSGRREPTFGCRRADHPTSAPKMVEGTSTHTPEAADDCVRVTWVVDEKTGALICE